MSSLNPPPTPLTTSPSPALSPLSCIVASVGAGLSIAGGAAASIAFFFALVTITRYSSCSGQLLSTKTYTGPDMELGGALVFISGIIAALLSLGQLLHVRKHRDISRPVATFGIVASLIGLFFILLNDLSLHYVIIGPTPEIEYHPAIYILVDGLLASLVGSGMQRFAKRLSEMIF